MVTNSDPRISKMFLKRQYHPLWEPLGQMKDPGFLAGVRCASPVLQPDHRAAGVEARSLEVGVVIRKSQEAA